MSPGWLATMGLLACASEPEPPPEPEDLMRAAREQMVEQSMVSPPDIRPRVTDERVLEAMRAVPRHLYVPAPFRRQAYADEPLPIGHEQTISQPYIVALMTQYASPDPGDTVLEVGTGSGYQAAVLARLVKHVYTIEIVEPLAERAAKTLADNGVENVTVRAGDGYAGWPEHAPFDAIVVTAAPDHVPEPLKEQLKVGGRLVLPVGPVGRVQELIVMEKKADGELTRTTVLEVAFVPLTGPGVESGKRDP